MQKTWNWWASSSNITGHENDVLTLDPYSRQVIAAEGMYPYTVEVYIHAREGTPLLPLKNRQPNQIRTLPLEKTPHEMLSTTEHWHTSLQCHTASVCDSVTVCDT